MLINSLKFFSHKGNSASTYNSGKLFLKTKKYLFKESNKNTYDKLVPSLHWWLRSNISGVHIGPCQTSMMKAYVKIEKGLYQLTVFTKRFHHRCLPRFEIRFWIYWLGLLLIRYNIQQKVSDEFSGHKSCESGDINFQIAMWFCVSHVLKMSCDFKGGRLEAHDIPCSVLATHATINETEKLLLARLKTLKRRKNKIKTGYCRAFCVTRKNNAGVFDFFKKRLGNWRVTVNPLRPHKMVKHT